MAADEFDVDPFGSLPDVVAAGLSEEEANTLRDALVPDTSKLVLRVPDASDVAAVPVPSDVPADAAAVKDVQYVVWGSEALDDIRPREVKREAAMTEDEYVAQSLAHTRMLIDKGLKDEQHQGKHRVDRTEEYARWRYRGFVCGEINTL